MSTGLPPEVLSQLRGIFVEEADQSLKEAQGHCAAWQPGEAVPHRIKAVLHGIKGSASAVELGEFAALIHDAEDIVVRASPPPDPQRVGDVLRGLRDLVPLARNPAGIPRPALAEVAAMLQAAAVKPEQTGAPVEVLAPLPAPRRAERVQVVEHTAVSTAGLAESVRLAAEVKRALSELRLAPGDADAMQRAAISCEELEALLERMRQSPGAEAVEGLEEEIAQLAAKLGKRVRLEISGRDLRVERRALQSARGALRHLLRNAVDHALETPQERRNAGKPETCRVEIHLAVRDGQLEVRLTDDGRGFDLDAIRARFAGLGEDLSALGDDEVLQKFALEGGSTRETATEVSGRGVGLSAVAHLALDSGGSFRVRSTRGRGSEISFAFPVSAYVAEVLTFSIGDVTLALPTSSIAYTSRRRNEGQELHTPVGEVVSVAGITARLADLGPVLGLADAAPRPFVLMVQHGEETLGLAVDEIGAVHRVVPRAAPPVVHPKALVGGLVVLPDTGAVQLLNAQRLIERASARQQMLTRPSSPAQAAAKPVRAAPRQGLEVLLVEDSAATREVYRLLLEADGHRVRTAVNGALGYAAAQESTPDVVLSDVDMPVQDGFGLTRAIRSSPKLGRIPVILLTSRDDANSRAEGAACGADAFLVKGTFTPATLRETFARLGLRPNA